MQYLGHFSFQDSRSSEVGERHGYFTLVVEAHSDDEALDKFESLLLRLKADGDIFDSTDAVYLDACIKLKAVPPGGLLAHWAGWSGEEVSCITTALPGVSEDAASAFYLLPDGASEDEAHDLQPFLDFTAD